MDQPSTWSPPDAHPPPDAQLLTQHLARIENRLRGWKALGMVFYLLGSVGLLIGGVSDIDQLPSAWPKLLWLLVGLLPVLAIFLMGFEPAVLPRLLAAGALLAVMCLFAWQGFFILIVEMLDFDGHGLLVFVPVVIWISFFALLAATQAHRFYLELQRWGLLVHGGSEAPQLTHPPPVRWWWRLLASVPALGVVLGCGLYFQDSVRFWSPAAWLLAGPVLCLPAVAQVFLIWWPVPAARLLAAGAALVTTVYGGIAVYLVIMIQWQDNWRFVLLGSQLHWAALWFLFALAWLWTIPIWRWARAEFEWLQPPPPAPRSTAEDTGLPADTAGWDQSQPQK